MVTSPANHINMQITQSGIYKSLPKIFKTISLERSLLSTAHRNKGNTSQTSIANKKSPATKINSRLTQSLIHRINKKTASENSSTITQRFFKTFPQNNTRIFNSMVLIHIQITFYVTRQIKKPVFTKRLQHMVKKTNRIFHITLSAAIQIQSQFNLSFTSNSFHSCTTHTNLIFTKINKEGEQTSLQVSPWLQPFGLPPPPPAGKTNTTLPATPGLSLKHHFS